MATTAQQPLEVAPWSAAPLGAWVAVPGISGTSKPQVDFLARLAGRMVEFFSGFGFPELGSRHPGPVSRTEKADREKDMAWASAYFMGFMAPY